MNTLSEAQTAYIAVDYGRRIVLFFAARTPDEHTTATYAANAFAFIINRNERLTLQQFADRIQQQYSMGDPRIAESVRVLRECAAAPVTADHLGVGDLSQEQSIWLKTCFKAQMREHGIDAELPADLLFASKHHVCEWAESCVEFEQDAAAATARSETSVPPDVLAALQRF